MITKDTRRAEEGETTRTTAGEDIRCVLAECFSQVHGHQCAREELTSRG